MDRRRSRWAVRGLLLAGAVALAALAARDSQVRQPDYLFRRAQESLAEGDRAAAAVFLQDLLARSPGHTAAHRLLARVYLDGARAKRPSARVADVAPALEHLRKAAALAPGDAGLQRALMDAEAEGGRLEAAAAAAARLLRVRPGDADALYLLAAGADKGRDDAAVARRLRELADLEAVPRFRTRVLAARHLARTGRDVEREALLERAEADALAVTARAESLEALSPHDRSAMITLLYQRVDGAPCVPESLARADQGMTVLERLAAAAPDDAQAAGEVSTHAAALLDAAERTLAAARRIGTAPPHAALLRRFVALAGAAVEAGSARPAVAERAALAAVLIGDERRAEHLLERAIETLNVPTGPKPEGVDGLRLLLVRRLFAAGRPLDARVHLKALDGATAAAGWCDLFHGALLLDDGKDAEAAERLLRARDRLGDRGLVRIALARALLAQRRWGEALAELNAVYRALGRLDPEERAWLGHALGDEADVHRLIAWAHAELGQWPQAQGHVEALKGTRHAAWAVRLTAASRLHREGAGRALETLNGALGAVPGRLDLAVSEAELLSAQGRDGEAAALLEGFAARQPDDLTAQAALLRWRLARGRHDQASAQADALAARRPDDPVATLLRAETWLATGRPDPALKACRGLAARGAALPPEAARTAPLIAALAAAQLGQTDLAAGLLDQAARDGRDPAARALQAGAAALLRGDHEAACDRFGDALAYTSVREPARVALGQSAAALAAARSAEAADAALARLAANHPRDAAVRGLRAELAIQAERWDDATRLVDALAELPDARDRAESLRAVIAARQGDAGEARRRSEALLKRRPDDLATRLFLVEVLGSLGLWQDALAESDEALRRAPDHPAAGLLRAEALERLGRRADALAALEALAARQPRAVAVHARLALLCASEGREDRSRQALDTLARLPADADTLLAVKVRRLCRLGRDRESRELADRAFRAEPSQRVALALSEAFAAESCWEPALAWNDSAARAAARPLRGRLDARGAGLLVLLAQARPAGKAALLAAACDRWRAVLAVNPADLVAANNLAWFLATELNRPEEAYEVASRARRLRPVADLPGPFVATLATIDRQLVRLPEARELLERRAAVRPEEPLTRLHLGLVYLAEKRPAAARESLVRALQLGMDARHEQEARVALDSITVTR